MGPFCFQSYRPCSIYALVCGVLYTPYRKVIFPRPKTSRYYRQGGTTYLLALPSIHTTCTTARYIYGHINFPFLSSTFNLHAYTAFDITEAGLQLSVVCQKLLHALGEFQLGLPLRNFENLSSWSGFDFVCKGACMDIFSSWFQFSFLNLCGETLGTAPTTGLLYQPQMIGDGGEICEMKIGRGNRSTRKKPTPAPLCSP
jgi:hypothetical protein